MSNSKQISIEHDPVYHGQDRGAAIARAQRIDGRVILSWPPSSMRGDAAERGYWSETPDGMIRLGETVIYPS